VPKIDAASLKMSDADLSRDHLQTFTYWRQIFTDGREMIQRKSLDGIFHRQVGWRYVRGDTKGFNGKPGSTSWDAPGQISCTIERFQCVDYGHMKIDVTIIDPAIPGRGPSRRKFICVRLGAGRVHLQRNNKDLGTYGQKLLVDGQGSTLIDFASWQHWWGCQIERHWNEIPVRPRFRTPPPGTLRLLVRTRFWGL
jgi:hypothetical protein